MQAFSHHTRQEAIERLRREPFDLLVIGGGITGAGIARDAALRGIKVALVEKGDFASGTSSKTARMIHGGLRYLYLFQLGLVRQSVKERDMLYRLAPRLVRPTPFTHPTYRGSRTNYLVMAIGLWFYDLLALFHNYKRHRMLSPTALKQAEPQVKRDGVTGAAHYYDYTADDARLTLAVIRRAHEQGAQVANYVQVTELVKQTGQVTGAMVRDVRTGDEFQIEAKVVVNATGVWSDAIQHLDDPNYHDQIVANRGTHVVFSRQRLQINEAVSFMAIDGKRAMYAVPWGNTCIVGTTDVNHNGSLDDVLASPEEVAFIVESANNVFAGANLTHTDIIATYAGVRPLLESDEKSAYMASREHKITASDSGLLSVAGGKLTTHRQMARDTVDRVVATLKRRFGITGLRPCQTSHAPIARETLDLTAAQWAALCEQSGLERAAIERLFRRYGPGYTGILTSIQSRPDLGDLLVPGLPYLRAEVVYVVQHEMALMLGDLMLRRLRIFYEIEGQGVAAAPQIAALMGECLGWDAAEVERQVATYVALVQQHRLV